jgi:hypothetical protein
MDLPLVGGSFTWLISQDPPVWEAFFTGVSQKRLPRLCSDHFPILLDCGDVLRGNRSFKFENMRLKAKGSVDMVKLWWDSYLFQGRPLAKKPLNSPLMDIENIENLGVVMHSELCFR